MAANHDSLHLYEKIFPKNTTQRVVDVTVLFLLFTLLIYRFLSLQDHGFPWFLALLCESWFTFNWVTIIITRWTPLYYKTNTQLLQQRVKELPAVDIVQVRAPFKYFPDESVLSSEIDHSWEFQQEWKRIKEEYKLLSRNIEDAAKKSAALDFDLSGELAVFSDTERRNHPAIVKIIWENNDGLSDGIPHLIYISREKRPKHPHYYKAGAMNVLTRVSGLMTNAPFMLNVDCDMFANNPQIVHQAMCLLLGSKEKDCAFVQCPQLFHNSPTHSLELMHEFVGKGIVGIQGPFYQGSGCIHRRKVIYGLWPDDTEDHEGQGDDDDYEELLKQLGNSNEFIKSAGHALRGETGLPMNPSNSLDVAHQVAGSAYENGSSWGEKVGWMYGSATEDLLTGLMIHTRGWRSGYCNPDPPGFLGGAPSSLLAAMIQQKRWSTGFLEILFSKNNPISATLTANLQIRMCIAYLYVIIWGLRSIPELCYAALPAYCIITNTNFLPKFQEPGIFILVAVFVIYNLYTLSEYIQFGFSIRSWWINQTMARIITMTSWTFGFLHAVRKLLGLSEVAFEITQKEGTTVLLVQLVALATGLLGLQSPPGGGQGSGLGEVFCSVLMVVWFCPFLVGLFRKGKYGIPLSTICKSAALSSLFVYLSKKIYMV
ncbi:hypothetical protein Q3G72_021977 [Acer saccharum]|nr:hypothetical protein Q3G72_021977 [Acer saccharum]